MGGVGATGFGPICSVVESTLFSEKATKNATMIVKIGSAFQSLMREWEIDLLGVVCGIRDGLGTLRELWFELCVGWLGPRRGRVRARPVG